MSASAPASEPGRAVLGAATRMGTVRLTVADLARSRDFYERVLGLLPSDTEDGGLAFSVPGGEALVEIVGDPAAPTLEPRRTGLFHLAILYPGRAELAEALLRLAHERWPLDGASDHLVSEALYLSDPDGNGIELYRDRPRADWPHEGDQLQMATLPLDLEDLVGELPSRDRPAGPIPRGTMIGHVHLQVAELREIEAFYAAALGFDVTVRHYPGALFLSAGGYHHHLGTNTWHSAGGSAPPPGAVGLREYELVLADEHELSAALARLERAGYGGEGTLIRDPSGNAVRLRAA